MSMHTISGLSSLLVCVDPQGMGDNSQRESMASWVWRLAQANGFMCAGGLLRNGRVQIRDLSRLDFGPTSDMATAALSNLTLLPRETVAELALTATLQHLGVQESPSGHPWVLCGTHQARARRGAAHVVCPACLRDDAIPYWRQSWRLATAVRCPLHHHAYIEQCPACGDPIILTHRRMGPLDLCESCGASYREHKDRTYRIARSQWIEAAPMSIRQEQLPLKVIDPVLWWTGLRALLFVLCVPRRAARLALADVPSTYLPTLRLIAQGPKTEFPQHPLAIRHALLRMTAWCTDDWPRNFIAAMKAVGVTASDFNAMEFSVPYWMHAVSNEHLYGKRYQVNQDEARAARAALSPSKRPISKKALKQQLGVSEGKALDVLLPARLKKLPDDTMLQIMVMLDGDIQNTASAREAQASALRDACCIAAAAWLGLSFTQVCKLTLRRGLTLNQTWHALAVRDGPVNHPTPHPVALARIFCRWGELYAKGVRHRFCRYGQDPPLYFVTRFGRPYGGFFLASRFADLLRRADVADWAAGARLLVNNGVHDQLTMGSVRSSTLDEVENGSR